MLDALFSPENTITKIIVAIFLGLFLGLRREIDFAQEKKESNDTITKKNTDFMGIRTMMLLSVLGVVSTLFPSVPNMPVIIFFSLSLLVGISHAYGSFVLHKTGLTAELAALLMFFIGVLIGVNQTIVAVFMTILLGAVNAFKLQLRSFAGTITPQEWQSALQLLLLSGLILPFLPTTAIDPWGVFVPFNIWFLVILVLTFEFLGYFLIKFYGAKGGIPLTGFLGSIVSSTAVTTSLASKSKNSIHTRIYSGAILIALGTMQIRVMIEIILLSPLSFWHTYILVPISMALVTLISGFWYIKTSTHAKNTEKKQRAVPLDLGSPLEIIPALKFGGIFMLILASLGLARHFLGDSGVYVAAFLSGLLDIDAIVLSTLESFRLGTLSESITKNAIFIALLVNTLVKIPYVFILSNKKITWTIAKVSLLSSLVAGFVLFFI
jgi:uncharacterized membrane protein (DUF4010 family)